MEIKIKMPLSSDEFVANLVLQRTGPLMAIGGGTAVNEWFNNGTKENIISFIRDGNNLNKYLQGVFSEIQREVFTFHKSCVKELSDNLKIVSIGPGNCVFELLLLRLISEGKIKKNIQNITLIDIESSPGLHRHGWNNDGAGYNSLSMAKSFLIDNSINCEVETINPTNTELPSEKFSLLFSILSMGFHYPIREYLTYMKNKSEDSAVIVFDCRKGQNMDELNELKKDFSCFFKEESVKSVRLFLKKIK